jgi:transketolase
MTTLYYVPFAELQRIRTATVPPVERTAVFANLCRINTLYMITRAGSGHIGTSFSCLDIVSWLFLNELRLPQPGAMNAVADIYFSSKGHDVPALYSVLLALGLLPFDLLHQLRRLNGLPGHPDVATPFIATNTGSLGMGISKARGMAYANRLLGRDGNIYVLTGDGELQEGQFWESLQPTVNQKIGEITVIVDHNKIQSDTWVSRVSDLGDLEVKLRSFGWHVARCDGHDLGQLSTVLAQCRDISAQPKIIIADTIKGRGVSFMQHTALKPEEKLYRFHSGAPDEVTYEKASAEIIDTVNAQLRALRLADVQLEAVARPPRPMPEKPQRLVAAYSQALVKQAERRPRLVVLDADLILDTGLIPFQERFPDRFFECGIAEQDMVSQAGGMALRGLLPFVHSFACFLSTRPNEQIYNNASERTKVVYVASLAGLVPGGPGHSHQSVRDISALAATPGLVMMEPSCEAEVELAVDFCVGGTRESCYLRLVSIPYEIPFTLPEGYRFELGRGVALTEGNDAVLFGYGPVMLTQAWQAAQLLATRGIGLKVINLPWLNRIDSRWLADLVAGYRRVFTIDNHYVVGGQGDMVLSALASLGVDASMRAQKFGLTDFPLCGTNDEVLQAHRLDAQNLSEAIFRALL